MAEVDPKLKAALESVGSVEGPMNELERTALRLARAMKEMDSTVSRINKAKMGVNFSDALDVAAKRVGTFRAGIEVSAEKAAKLAEEFGEINPLLKKQSDSYKSLLTVMDRAEFGFTGLVGGVLAAAKAVDSMQNSFLGGMRESITTLGAAASDSKQLQDDLFDTSLVSQKWRMSEQEFWDSWKGTLGIRREGFDKAIEGFTYGAEKGAAAVLSTMRDNIPKSGMALASQFKLLQEELRKGQLQFKNGGPGMKDFFNNIKTISAGSELAGVGIEFYSNMVMDVSSDFLALGKTTKRTEANIRDFAMAVQEGVVQLSTLKEIGGFEKSASPEQLLQFGAMAAGLGERPFQKAMSGPGGIAGMSARVFKTLRDDKNFGLAGRISMAEREAGVLGLFGKGASLRERAAGMSAVQGIPGISGKGIPELTRLLEITHKTTSTAEANKKLSEMMTKEEQRANKEHMRLQNRMQTSVDAIKMNANKYYADWSRSAFGGQAIGAGEYLQDTKEVGKGLFPWVAKEVGEWARSSPQGDPAVSYSRLKTGRGPAGKGDEKLVKEVQAMHETLKSTKDLHEDNHHDNKKQEAHRQHVYGPKTKDIRGKTHTRDH